MSAPSGPAAWAAAADVAEMVAAADVSHTRGCLNVTFAGLPEATWLQLKAEADFKGVNLTRTITMNVEPSDSIDLIRSKIWAITGIETELCLLTFFPQKTVLQDFIQFRHLRADPCTLHAHTPATAETAVEAVGPEVPLSQQEESREHYTSDEDSDYASTPSSAASRDYASAFDCVVQQDRRRVCVACNDECRPYRLVGRLPRRVIKTVAAMTVLSDRQVERVIDSLFSFAINELKKNGHFKFIGMLRLKMRPPTPARLAFSRLHNKVIACKPKKAQVKAFAMRKLKLRLAEELECRWLR